MPFDLQPTLKDDLLTLRPLEEADRAALFAVASDPLIWAQHPQSDRYQRPVFDAFFDKAIASKGALIVLDTKTGAVLGSSRYYDWDAAMKSIVIGFTFISRACWGKGHNRALKKLMLDHAFKQAATVYFHIGKGNLRSRKAIEKIGAKLHGEMETKLANGNPTASVVYQIQRSTWNHHVA